MADRWLSIDWPVLFSEMYSVATASCAHVPQFQIQTIATNPLYSNIAFRICDAQTLYNFYRHLIMCSVRWNVQLLNHDVYYTRARFSAHTIADAGIPTTPL